MEVERARKLFSKWIECFPTSCEAWTTFAEFEAALGETERARAIYESACNQQIDTPENAWKAFIEFEIGLNDFSRVETLYEQLVSKSQHVKVWISYGSWLIEQHKKSLRDKGRTVFRRGYNSLKEQGLKEERVLLLEKWLQLDPKHRKEIEAMMPKRVQRRKDDQEEGWEEFYDYVFPDDQEQQKSNKIIEMAHKWKLQQE